MLSASPGAGHASLLASHVLYLNSPGTTLCKCSALWVLKYLCPVLWEASWVICLPALSTQLDRISEEQRSMGYHGGPAHLSHLQ